MTQSQFPCASCGAALEYQPGTAQLNCPYCGNENHIPQSAADIEEIDYRAVLEQQAEASPSSHSATVTCASCNANFTLAPNLQADDCPFCGSAVVTALEQHEHLKPGALLAFSLTAKEARERFGVWLQGLWFAPEKVKRYARADGGLTGIYVPYWTYDAATTSFYRGERGDAYWVTTTNQNEQGNPVRKRKIRWTSVSGSVWRDFDDVLILASQSVPRLQTDRLTPWDLSQLIPYSDEYLSGFQAETYQLEVQQGFAKAKVHMDEQIRTAIKRDIGGDRQRIHQVASEYNQITFKHILLPVYLATYRYRDKVYQFVINGQTGEVQGERPYSAVKLGLLLVAIAAIVGTAIMLFAQSR